MADPITILLIEDDPHDQFFITEALHFVGFRGSITHVDNAILAQEFLKSEEAAQSPPHVIISDSSSSSFLSGIDLLEWTRNQNHLKLIPFFVLSGALSPAVMSRAQSLGVNGLFVKGIGMAEITQQMEEILSSLPPHSKASLPNH